MMRIFRVSPSRKATRILHASRRRSILLLVLISLLLSLSAPTRAESKLPPIATTPDKFSSVLVHCYRSRRRPVPVEHTSAAASGSNENAGANRPPDEEIWIERETGFAFLDEDGELTTTAASAICGGDEHSQVGLISPSFRLVNEDGSNLNEWLKNDAGPHILNVINTTRVPLSPINRPMQHVDAVQARTQEYFNSFHTFMTALPGYESSDSSSNSSLLLLPLDPRIEFEAHVTMLPVGWTMSAPFTPPESYHPWALCNTCGEDVAWQQAISGVRWKCNHVKGRCRGREYCDFHYQQHLAHMADTNVTEPPSYFPLRRPVLPSRLLWSPTAIEVVLNAVSNFGDAPYLGEIGVDAHMEEKQAEYAADGRLPSDDFPGQYHPVDRLKQYIWTSYRELKEEFMALGASLRRLIPKGSFVGLYAPNSREWAALDYACLARGMVTVGLHARWTAPTILRIVNQTKMAAILIKGNQQLATIVDVAQQYQQEDAANPNPEAGAPTWSLKYILMAHSPPRDGPKSTAELEELAALTKQAASFGMVVLDYSSFVSLSSTKSAVIALSDESLPYSAEDELASLIYTSGSTDAPKGCMYTQNMARYELIPGRAAMGLLNCLMLEAFPFAWATGHAILRSAMVHGCALALYNGSPANLIAEFQRVAPTKIVSVPAVWNQLFSMYKNFVVRHEKELTMEGGEITKAKEGATTIDPNLFLPRAVSPHSPDRRRAFQDDAAFPYIAEFRQQYPVGPRMKHASIGSAMSTPELRSFLRALFGAERVTEGYGTSEAGGLMADGVMQYAERRLIDVPELGYFSTDKPFPRGELLVRTPHTIPGYYLNPEATAAKFTADGFFRTGDVVEQRGDAEFHIIDRVSNFFKLSNGEFLSPETLEAVYMRSPLVHQVFVHGEPQRSGVVAIVVPNIPALQAAFDKIGDASGAAATNVDVSTLLHSPEVAALIRADIARECHAASLSSAMFPLAVHITSEPFTAANGLLTVSSKPSRTAVRTKFQAEIHHMYATFEETRSELGDHPSPNSLETPSTTTSTPLVAILARILAVSEQLLHESVDVSTLGLTSLSATQIASTVQKELGATLPVQMLLDTNTPVTLESLTKMVNGAGGKNQERKDVHDPKAAEEKLIQQLQTDVLLPLEVPAIEVVTQAIPLRELYERHALQRTTNSPVLGSARHVLLTGATGFLGGQLLIELLNSSAVGNHDLVVHCLIRPSVQTDHSRAQSRTHLQLARQRLIQSLKSRDLWLGEELMNRVLVYSGSVETPMFGLPAEVYQTLVEHVSHVYHSAANVNWILPYTTLRSTNVVGTQQVLQFVAAARSRQQHQEEVKLVHVSTASVRHDFLKDHMLLEANEITPSMATSLRSAISRHAGSGYALSKWVSEILVKRAAAAIEKPARISSPGFIGPHSVSGDCGQFDFLSRYIDTVLSLGVYVESMREFEYTPVDQVAREIILVEESDRTKRTEQQQQQQLESITMNYSQIGAAIRRAVTVARSNEANSEPNGSNVPHFNQPLPTSPLDFLARVRAREDVALFPLLSVISQPGFFGRLEPKCRESSIGDTCAATLPEEHSDSFGLEQCVRRRILQLSNK